MAGSISLSMSQQFKLSGKLAIPLSGGRLYFIKAGTTSEPQNAYQDYGLSIPHPNPIILDEAGRIPAFYLADGFIKVRLVDSDGLTQIEQDGLLVVGPSEGGGGGGGGGGDPTTIFKTGDSLWLDVQGTRAGWVRDNGRTIGSATSGATERANADCEALFNWLWNTYDETFCPVSTGRGASSIADWAANKTIQLRNKQNCVMGGLDDMGAPAAGGFANVPIISGSPTEASSVIGGNNVVLNTSNLPPYTPSGTIGIHDPGHAHGGVKVDGGVGSTNPGGLGRNADGTSAPAWTGITASFDGAAQGGTSTPTNNVQMTVLGTFYRKL